MAQSKIATKVARLIGELQAQAKYAIAAAGVAQGGDYCDFFVENGGDGKPWHEKCPDDLVGVQVRAQRFSKDRVKRIDELKLRPSASDDYCDFFVENGGDGKPWHEKCPDATRVKDLLTNPTRRAILLSRSQVIRTLERVQQR
jgi:hypothetical protein